MLIAPLLLGLDYIARDPVTKPVATYGAFRVEREDCVPRDPPVAVLHYAHCFSKARLIWSSTDGKIKAVYEDNGGLLTRRWSFTYRQSTVDNCAGTNGLTAYRATPASAADWQQGTRPFAAMLTRCTLLEPDQVAAYQTEYQTAVADYPAAAGRLRTLAQEMFGGLDRCVEQRLMPRTWADMTCVRHAGPAS